MWSRPAELAGLSDGYLNDLKAGTGRVIISATRGSDPAYVRWVEVRRVHGPLPRPPPRRSPAATAGVIRVLDLYSYVQERVVADQPNQRPVLKARARGELPDRPLPRRQAPRPRARRAAGGRVRVRRSLQLSPSRSPDKTWVRKVLLPRLKAEGLKVFIDYVDFQLGAPIVTEMERAVVPEPVHGRRALAGRPHPATSTRPGEHPLRARRPGAESAAGPSA